MYCVKLQAVALLLPAVVLLDGHMTADAAEPDVQGVQQVKPSYPLFGLVGVEPAERRGKRALSALDPERFAWCSHLLTVTRDRSTFFGKPAVLRKKEGKFQFVPLSPMYFLPIGDPAETLPLEKYEVRDSGCYARRFENAVVFVNPGKTAATIPLEGKLADVAEKLGFASITLRGGDGRIVALAATSSDPFD